MLNSIRWRARARLLLVLMATLSVSAAPRLFVVCVSEDNHVQVESRFEALPCEPVLIDDSRPADRVPYETCTDFPATTQLARVSYEVDSPVAAMTIPILPLAVHVLPAKRLILPRHSEWIPSKSLATIRSTVLRI